MSWRTRWRTYEYVRNSIWIVPGILGTLAIVAGIVLPDVDEHVDTTIGVEFGQDAARSVLGALAGGMITFTGFVFSILLLAVQFGSSQFSPRLLRRFLRDPTTKIALGTFIATFLYALTVLRVIGTADDEAFVPSNAVSVAMLLLLASMLMFLRLIHRTTQGLRVATVLAELGSDARKVVAEVYPEPIGSAADESDERDADERPAEARDVTYLGAPGILQSVDREGLVVLARTADAVIEMVPRVGDFLAEGYPLFRIHGDAGAIDDRRLQGSVAIGDERTMRQDVGFAFRVLADISARALSPGVNDPTSATQALDQIELLLRQLATRRLTPGIARDEAGRVRLRFPTPTWEDFLSLGIDETRHFSEGSVQVMRRLRALLTDLRTIAPPSRQAAIDTQLLLLDAGVERTFAAPGDRVVARTYDRQGLGASVESVER